MKILVVDDDEALTRTIARTLKGHEVVIATDLAVVMARVRGGDRFDLVLCDLNMPGGKGTIVLGELRAWFGSNAPMLVLMTGGDDDVLATTDLVLRKPFAPGELQAVLDLATTRQEMRHQVATIRMRRLTI